MGRGPRIVVAVLVAFVWATVSAEVLHLGGASLVLTSLAVGAACWLLLGRVGR
jgi:hypothetical protein